MTYNGYKLLSWNLIKKYSDYMHKSNQLVFLDYRLYLIILPLDTGVTLNYEFFLSTFL